MRGSVHDKNPGKKSWRLGVEGSNYYVEPQVEIMYGHMNNFNEDDAFVFKQK